ncbi:DsbA family protein [Pedococcus bigeumensis]|uniref:Disulfide bond formation protein DsbA n=1 Tax=Pedococcus bigeumensis TaxID=433644 RepID=A0A502CV91_9MICO|nr:thioredoxin domain-containing protein [Pedococcus bigeumensis]TPG16828.1 disulfide bond formation protein DsbA [Pedococcus bigeumensis]
MKRNAVISAATVAVFAAIVAAALTLGPESKTPADAAEPGQSAGRLIRDDSHRLGAPGTGKVVLVEFLDFECESCRAAYPVVEDLRTKYAGKVDFVVRYFPIPSHANALNAAVAVESAAQQGKFEEMYKRMYETQTSWGEQQDSKADVFRGFAAEMGLDMVAYDKAVADKATAERVERDREDGLALGVNGTPTFFLNGKQLEPTSVEDFHAQIDAALAG